MKVVILAGGLGTRLAEETQSRPKPMIEVGGMPLLWHVMSSYARHGFKDFVIALGYKGDVIKRWFRDRYTLQGDVTIDLRSGVTTLQTDKREIEDWTVRLAETGHDTMTGGRLRRLSPLLRSDPFFLTYGDGVSNVSPHAVLECHRRSKKLATITAVRPPARFGGLVLEADGEGAGANVKCFVEKPQIGEGWINGGFMILDPCVLDRIEGDQNSLETDVLEGLAIEGKLGAYRHDGFWQCVDTIRDLKILEAIWDRGNAPWTRS